MGSRGMIGVSEIRMQPLFQDKSGDTPLHDAILLQNDECAKILIECPNTNLQHCNRQDFNALHYACLRDHVTLVWKDSLSLCLDLYDGGLK